jgi:hypothetical protein
VGDGAEFLSGVMMKLLLVVDGVVTVCEIPGCVGEAVMGWDAVGGVYCWTVVL